MCLRMAILRVFRQLEPLELPGVSVPVQRAEIVEDLSEFRLLLFCCFLSSAFAPHRADAWG